MGTEYDPEEMLAYGVELFNSEAFFDAHEVLEDLWLVDRSPSRRFFQGLIQIASAYHHLAKGNLRGAADLLVRGSDHLRSYLPSHLRVDLADLLAHVGRDADTVRDLRGGLPGPGRVEPPKIRYVRDS